MNVAPPPADGAQRPPDGRGHALGVAAQRLLGAWRALHGDQRLAALAALGLFLALVLPWYSTTASSSTSHHNALWTLGWVEGSVLLVAAGVLLLLFARAEDRAFHLPGGDGGVILAAGVWAAFLIVWRFFDRPDVGRGVAVGLQWGIFVALGLAAALAYAGTRIRSAQRPEPPIAQPPEDGAPSPPPGTVQTRPLIDERGTRPPA